MPRCPVLSTIEECRQHNDCVHNTLETDRKLGVRKHSLQGAKYTRSCGDPVRDIKATPSIRSDDLDRLYAVKMLHKY